MPAATVIPAPLVCMKVVAVKKLVGLLYERTFTRKGNYLVEFVPPKFTTTTTMDRQQSGIT